MMHLIVRIVARGLPGMALASGSKARMSWEPALSAKKWFMSPDGVVRAQFVEELNPISKAVYDILHAKIMSMPK